MHPRPLFSCKNDICVNVRNMDFKDMYEKQTTGLRIDRRPGTQRL
jgi:hypothetical protein